MGVSARESKGGDVYNAGCAPNETSARMSWGMGAREGWMDGVGRRGRTAVTVQGMRYGRILVAVGMMSDTVWR